MLATLAIINMAVAATLIHETADARAEKEPAAVVATADNTRDMPKLTAK